MLYQWQGLHVDKVVRTEQVHKFNKQNREQQLHTCMAGRSKLHWHEQILPQVQVLQKQLHTTRGNAKGRKCTYIVNKSIPHLYVSFNRK